MKKILLICLFALALTPSLSAQTFSLDSLVVANVNSGVTNVEDFIHNMKSDSIIIQWKVIATDFPADWYVKLGICDNNICYGYLGCWDTTSHTGTLHTTYGYPGGTTTGDFHMQINLDGTSAGQHFVVVYLQDDSITANHATVRFVITHYATGVTTVTSTTDNTTLYPNPATNSTNFSIKLSEATDLKLEIYNAAGTNVNTINKHYNAGQQNIPINTATLPAGLYTIKAITGTGTITKQLAVVK